MSDGDTNENIRNSKRAYRKKAFQTSYSLKGDAVNASPVPYSSYSTETSVATQPQRAGIDPGTFKRPVRPSLENLDLHPNNVDSKSYPWHLVPKSDSSNLIQRQNVNLTTILQPGGAATSNFLDSGQFVDLIVINANDDNILGTQTWSAPAGSPAAAGKRAMRRVSSFAVCMYLASLRRWYPLCGDARLRSGCAAHGAWDALHRVIHTCKSLSGRDVMLAAA